MSGDTEGLLEEEFKKIYNESKILDKLILIGEKFIETEEYKNSPLSDQHKSIIVKVFLYS